MILDNYGLKQNQYKRTNKYRLDNLLQNKNSRRLSIGDQDIMRNRSSTQFIGQRVNNKQDQDQEKLQITRGSSFYMDINSIQNTRKLSTDIKLYGNEKDQLSQTSIQDILDRKVHNRAITNQRPNGQKIGRLQLKPLASKINYNIYNREDHQLSQISYTQINYLSKAIEQYKDTLNQVNRYYQKRGQLPKRQLQMEPMLSDQV